MKKVVIAIVKSFGWLMKKIALTIVVMVFLIAVSHSASRVSETLDKKRYIKMFEKDMEVVQVEMDALKPIVEEYSEELMTAMKELDSKLVLDKNNSPWQSGYYMNWKEYDAEDDEYILHCRETVFEELSFKFSYRNSSIYDIFLQHSEYKGLRGHYTLGVMSFFSETDEEQKERTISFIEKFGGIEQIDDNLYMFYRIEPYMGNTA